MLMPFTTVCSADRIVVVEGVESQLGGSGFRVSGFGGKGDGVMENAR